MRIDLSVSTSDLPGSHPARNSASPHAAPSPPAWKNEVTARVRDHRTRRTRTPENQPALPGMENSVSADGASSIAARVADRYARIPSYREALAAEAAAREQARLDSLAAAAAAPPSIPAPAPQAASNQGRSASEPAYRDSPPEPWQPDLLRYSVSSESLPAPRSTPAQARAESLADPTHRSPAEVVDPLEEALIEPAAPLPARIIEFPRELVAPRKARPRLAEGPLRNEAPHPEIPAGCSSLVEPLAFLPDPSATPSDFSAGSLATPQAPLSSANASAAAETLRILEAEPEDSTAPITAAPPLAEWHSIHLDAEASIFMAKQSYALLDSVALDVASLEDRVMAAVVDLSLMLAAFLLFVVVFAACSTSLPGGHIALVGAGATLIAMGMLYQILFFSLTDATPGMRYARIALCTFDDENPTRQTLRRRIAALLLSALPLGLGFLWALFDEDSLGWHDRITQTYQRSYREL
jgi:uncharacterized RDD family membrane protein YckC